MILVIWLAIFLCFMIEMILLGFHFFSFLACVAIIAGVVLHFRGKKEKWITSIVFLLILIGVIGLCFRERDSTIKAYGNEMKKVNAYLEEEKTEEALEILEELEANYGQRGGIIMAQVTCHMIDREYEEALERAMLYPDKKSKDYYSVMQEIYLQLGKAAETDLNAMYLEAAGNWPTWLEMQYSAGMVQLEKKEFASAKSYFERALKLDYENGMAYYLLGVTEYYAGNYKECLYYYNIALKKGVPEDVEESIRNQVVVVKEVE